MPIKDKFFYLLGYIDRKIISKVPFIINIWRRVIGFFFPFTHETTITFYDDFGWSQTIKISFKGSP